MNILIVCYEYPPLGGGGGVAVADVANELAKRHRVHVLTSAAAGMSREERVDDRDLTIFRVPVIGRRARAVASISSLLSFYPLGICCGQRWLARYSYDVVNSWFAIPSGLVGRRLAAGVGAPHVLTIIGGDIYDPSKWHSLHRNRVLKQVVAGLFRQADRLIAISHDVAARARETSQADQPIEIVPLGVDPPVYRPSTRAELGLHEKHVYVATVGRLVRRKDHATLLKALQRLDDDRVHLLIIGDGPEHENLGALAGRLGITKQVHFLGFIPQERKYQLLASSDLFSLTSLHEGFGLVYLEAMHCGLPVIAGNSGGQTDFLVDGRTGFLVRPGDVAGLEQALHRLLEQPKLRRSIGEANRQLAASYTVADTVKRYETAFALLADGTFARS